ARVPPIPSADLLPSFGPPIVRVRPESAVSSSGRSGRGRCSAGCPTPTSPLPHRPAGLCRPTAPPQGHQPEHVRGVAGRPDGGDDLRFPHLPALSSGEPTTLRGEREMAPTSHLCYS